MGAVVEKVGDIGQGAIDTVGDLGAGIDRTVRDVVPGGWTTAALLAGGYYYAPEIGAYINSAGATVPASEVVGGAVATPVTQGAVTGTALGELGATSLSPVVAGNVGSFGAVAPVTAGAGAGAAAGAGMSNYLVPAAIAGSSLLGANAARNAAGIQAGAQNQANQLQYQMFKEQQALQEPWRQTGINALNKLNRGDILNEDPGYAFRLSEGQKALERSAAARGGLISGSALKAATRYGQDMGSQEFQNAFNRYSTLAGYGQNASNTLTNAAGNVGANVGAGITSAGAANAAGGVGQANALASGVGQYLNYASNQNLADILARQRQSSYTG
jgi:hypothetical protein